MASGAIHVPASAILARDVKIDRLAAIYDEFARTYDDNRGLFDMSPVIADFMADLPATGNLLDLGCGAGEPFAKEFLDRGWSVTGVDFSARMLELAARYVPRMTRVHGDMREVAFNAGSFDAVCAVYSLFHVPHAQHPEIFRRVRSWLRSQGVFFFTYATRAYTGHERFDGSKEFLGQSLFYSHATPDELRQQLGTAGFHNVEAEERSIGGEAFLWVTARP